MCILVEIRMIIVTIPAYNEELTIAQLIRDIKRVMNNLGKEYKIVVVDDGSTDNTAEIAKNSGAIVVSHPKRYGLAETFRTELEQCLRLGADVIVHIDADYQYLPEEIPKLLECIDKGYDIVLGSRFKGKIEFMPIIKKIGNKLFSKVVTQITGIKITDSQTGFRAFTKDVAKIRLTSNHTYTQEQIIRAVKRKFRVTEVPVHFKQRKGKSKLIKNPFEYGVKACINILRVYRDNEPLKFFGIIGTALFSIGIIIGLWLVFTFLRKGFIGRTPTLILCVLLLITGIQIIIFGFLADMQQISS